DHRLQEVILGHMIVKSFLGYDMEVQKFAQSVDAHHDARLNEAKIVARSAASVQMIGGMIIALILFLAQSPFCRLSGGDFACLLTAILALLRPLKQLSAVSELSHKVVASSESLMKLKQYPKEHIDSSSDKKVNECSVHSKQPIPASLEFCNVTFCYPEQNETASLQNISFKLLPGQTIALVGPSGGGKSTLVSLVPRFYAFQGQILLNDIDITTMPLLTLRKDIAFVGQETILFNDTIAANIAYGSKEIDWVELRHAAQLAFAEDFINEMPQGFLTKIGVGGYRLSGGERQRLALARAFYKNAPLLILDEATSALDADSEEQVQRALTSLMSRSSTLVIAHHLNTIIRADKILFLDKGMIIEQGTHAELIEKNGYYAQLYAQSFRENQNVIT
ncbi:MAG: ATP-binding cassette domain-containing protein, partial [Gammaproteobacteria bacterium]|nr:ATP-binding cassette domain-containing protein [Gammaproteobacteria bacterium]